MACSCQQKKGVQVKATNGRTVYTSSSVASAKAVAARYPGSEVWQDGQRIDPPAEPAAAPEGKTLPPAPAAGPSAAT
jgi:hypothetical protein